MIGVNFFVNFMRVFINSVISEIAQVVLELLMLPHSPSLKSKQLSSVHRAFQLSLKLPT